MRSEEVKIGGVYQAKVGGALRRVTVTWAREGSLTLAGRRRPTRYGCLVMDTGRIIRRTAAALRALPNTPESAAAQAREAARRAVRSSRECPACGAGINGLDADGDPCADCARGRLACHACGWDPSMDMEECRCPIGEWYSDLCPACRKAGGAR